MVLDATQWQLIQNLAYPKGEAGSMHGLAVSRDGAAVYVAGSYKHLLEARRNGKGRWQWAREIPLSTENRQPFRRGLGGRWAHRLRRTVDRQRVGHRRSRRRQSDRPDSHRRLPLRCRVVRGWSDRLRLQLWRPARAGKASTPNHPPERPLSLMTVRWRSAARSPESTSQRAGPPEN